jgi:hypothetical protein
VGRRTALLALVALGLAACGNTPTQGISGVLVEGGGAAPIVHAPVPVRGYIKLSGHETVLAVTNRRGKFSVDVPPGTYRIASRPGADSSGSFVYWCGGQQVVLRAGPFDSDNGELRRSLTGA